MSAEYRASHLENPLLPKPSRGLNLRSGPHILLGAAAGRSHDSLASSPRPAIRIFGSSASNITPIKTTTPGTIIAGRKPPVRSYAPMGQQFEGE